MKYGGFNGIYWDSMEGLMGFTRDSMEDFWGDLLGFFMVIEWEWD